MTISLKADPGGTFGEILINGTPYARVSADGLRTPTDGPYFRRENILGTVSQSGGVPTGAVVERGSNANGEYVRFADGTQICTAELLYTNDVTAATGSLFISSKQDFVLAASFVSVTGQSAYSRSFGGTWLTGEAGAPAGSIGIRAMRAVSTTSDFTVQIIVIGRWF